MASEDFILGRGKVLINGRHVGNTPKFGFLGTQDDGIVRIMFATDNISAENLMRYFDALVGGIPGQRVEYEPANPQGRQIGFVFPNVKILAGPWQFKDDDWQQLGFLGEVEGLNGRLFDYKYDGESRHLKG